MGSIDQCKDKHPIYSVALKRDDNDNDRGCPWYLSVKKVKKIDWI
jgi:hypothetical protein